MSSITTTPAASLPAIESYRPYALAALRVATALVFLAHGTAKLLAFPQVKMFDGLQLFSLMGLAGVLEIVGSLLLIVGLFTRPVAFVLSGFMAVAYFMAHAPQNVFPILNGGDSAIQFSFVFLYLVFAGPGAFALDNRNA